MRYSFQVSQKIKIEIKDSCDFVQISEFGYCVGKTFVQLLKIIKWFLKFWLKDTRKAEKGKASLQSQTSQDLNLNHSNICAFCEQIIKSSPCGRENKGKRKGVAINDINTEIRQAKMMHKREINHLMDRKELILDRYTQKEIQSKKFIGDYSEIDLLNKKHIAMKLQISNNETVLEEVLNEFSMKTEAIARFVTNTQASCIQDFKINQESDFVQFEDQMRILIAEKYGQARGKMKELVSQKLMDYDRARKQKLTNKQVQTQAQDYPNMDKNEIKLKQMNAAYQKLKNQLESEKSLNQSLRLLLQSKSIQFEKEFLNFRKQVIKNDVKSKHYLKSLKSFKQGIEESMRQDDESQASIKLDDGCSETSSFKHHMARLTNNNLKDKVKNRYSIKFTLENNQIESADHSLSGTLKFKPLKQDAEIQTDFVHILDQSTQFIKRNSRKSLTKQTAKSLFRQEKHLKQTLEKSGLKKSQSNLYNHIKSKVIHMIQKQSVKSVKTVRKDFKQTRSSFMGELSKKLSVEYLYPKNKQKSFQSIKIYKITSDPTYTQIISFVIGKEDISNLFLNEGNAKNYQCLMYRNSLMNLAHQNQKRLINYSERLESSDLQWITKKQTPVNESIQNRLLHAFYYQLNSLKRKQKPVYEQVKRLLRCPYEISKKVEVFQLEQFEIPSNDIEVSELKKMMGIILKFHCECLRQERDALCEHIVNFSKKLGISFS